MPRIGLRFLATRAKKIPFQVHDQLDLREISFLAKPNRVQMRSEKRKVKRSIQSRGGVVCEVCSWCRHASTSFKAWNCVNKASTRKRNHFEFVFNQNAPKASPAITLHEHDSINFNILSSISSLCHWSQPRCISDIRLSIRKSALRSLGELSLRQPEIILFAVPW